MMTLIHKLMICGVAFVLCASARSLYAQRTGGGAGTYCFTIKVSLNGKLVDGPKAVTFKTNSKVEEAALEEGCFRVPPDVLKEKTVDVLFEVARNKIHLSSILIGFFAGPWDIDLEDKHFGREVVLPKHARINEACAVIFHVGEPETAVTQVPCRTPL
jgi:hypothetical protein